MLAGLIMRKRGCSCNRVALRCHLRQIVNISSLAADRRVPDGGDSNVMVSSQPVRLLLIDANPLVWRAAADDPNHTLRVFAELFQRCVFCSRVIMRDMWMRVCLKNGGLDQVPGLAATRPCRGSV